MPNGKNGGKRKNRRTTEDKDEKGGRTVETVAPALSQLFLPVILSNIKLNCSLLY